MLRALSLALCALIVVACGRPAAWQSAAPAPLQPQVSQNSERTGNVTLNTTVWRERYAVGGATLTELRHGLDRSSPHLAGGGEAGGQYDALTSWSLRWSYRFSRDRGECALASANVEVDVRLVLPEAAAPERLSADAATRWTAYVEALRVHEEGHLEQQLAGAHALAEAFRATPAQPTCEALEALLNDLGASQIDAGREADAAYDAQTEHGRSQGAVFP